MFVEFNTPDKTFLVSVKTNLSLMFICPIYQSCSSTVLIDHKFDFNFLCHQESPIFYSSSKCDVNFELMLV